VNIPNPSPIYVIPGLHQRENDKVPNQVLYYMVQLIPSNGNIVAYLYDELNTVAQLFQFGNAMQVIWSGSDLRFQFHSFTGVGQFSYYIYAFYRKPIA